MKVVLSHISALEYWRSTLSDAGLARATCRAKTLPEKAPHGSLAKKYLLSHTNLFSPPIHVLALDGRRKNSSCLVIHQAKTLPDGSLRTIVLPGCDEPLLITSPELTFVHLASLLSFSRTVHLGYEFCGTYAPDKNEFYGMRNRLPLTSLSKLNCYTNKAKHIRGAQAARTALPHVLDGSASPRESMLAALLALPYARGGSNIEQPRMNAPLVLGKRNRRDANQASFRCDLLWPDKRVAVEYDSTLCHTGATRIANDATRRNAIESLGFTVITATWPQVKNYREYTRLVHILAGHLGTRIRPTCADYSNKQLALRSELLP